MTRDPAHVKNTRRYVDEHRVVVPDDDRQSLKQESHLGNITSCSTKLLTQVIKKL